MKPFKPAFLLGNKHMQTFIGILKSPEDKTILRREKREYVSINSNTRIAVDCNYQENKEKLAIIVHGLTGSSRSKYVLRIAEKLFKQGWSTARMNLRNCGETEGLTATLYHAGQSNDLDKIIQHYIQKGFSNISIIGFSLSGNLILKWAGLLKNAHLKKVKKIALVSPLVDLEASYQTTELISNKLYKLKILSGLRNMILQKAKHFPGLYDASSLANIESVKAFDDFFHSKYSGFKNADDYYKKESSLQFIPKIKIKTLIIHAEDDPLVPGNIFKSESIRNNKHITLLLTKQGGHVGFFSKKSKNEDRFWAENRIVDFLKR